MAAPERSPRRIGMAEVEQLVGAARTWRGRDYRHGGGSCHAAVLEHLAWGHKLLRAWASDRVTIALWVALADLHNLAGWICFDTGRVDDANIHFQQALILAQQSHDDALIANVHYRLGRVHLHHHAQDQALTQFHRGQAAAQACGSDHGLAILFVNQAWAHATMGAVDQALRLLDQSREAFARADLANPPGWAAFFDEADLSSMVGIVHAELAQTVHSRHTGPAISALSHAATQFTDDMARSKTFTLISLATCHFLDGDTDQATAIGTQAVELAGTLASLRSADRMRPLHHQADQHRDNPDARHLARLITTFAAA